MLLVPRAARVNEIANNLSDGITGAPNRLQVIRLLKGAEVNLVNMNQLLVVDRHLEVVRHESAGCAWSSVSDDDRLVGESTAGTATIPASAASGVTSAALLKARAIRRKALIATATPVPVVSTAVSAARVTLVATAVTSLVVAATTSVVAFAAGTFHKVTIKLIIIISGAFTD